MRRDGVVHVVFYPAWLVAGSAIAFAALLGTCGTSLRFFGGGAGEPAQTNHTSSWANHFGQSFVFA